MNAQSSFRGMDTGMPLVMMAALIGLVLVFGQGKQHPRKREMAAEIPQNCFALPITSFGPELLWTRAVMHCDGGKRECLRDRAPGEIVVLEAPDGKVTGCNYWRAGRTAAAAIVKEFDAFESYGPDVVYRSTGKYPVYTQRGERK